MKKGISLIVIAITVLCSSHISSKGKKPVLYIFCSYRSSSYMQSAVENRLNYSEETQYTPGQAGCSTTGNYIPCGIMIAEEETDGSYPNRYPKSNVTISASLSPYGTGIYYISQLSGTVYGGGKYNQRFQ